MSDIAPRRKTSPTTHAIDRLQTKSEISLYLTAVFSHLKEDVDDLICQFAKLTGFIEVSDQHERFPREFKRTMCAAREACVELETMAGLNQEMLYRLMHPEKFEELSIEMIQDLLDSVKTETLGCQERMAEVLQRFANVNDSLHKFLDLLRSKAEVNDAVTISMLEKFQGIIPWRYIPQFLNVLIPRRHSTAKFTTDPQIPVRTPQECLEYAEQLVDPLNRVMEAWGVLLRQVILVSRLLTVSSEYFNVDTRPEEVKELYQFFGCMQAATRDFVTYIPESRRKGKTSYKRVVVRSGLPATSSQRAIAQ